MRWYSPIVLLFLAGAPVVGFWGASSAQRKIDAANQALSGNPNSLQAYNDLAAALCERARENGDVSYFTAAQSALEHSFQIAPGDYSAQKLQVAVLLGLHQWVGAWQLATNLNRLVPDDVAVWGLVAETNLALGNYPQAQKAAQWMFDLRPASAGAFLIAAKVREVYGDLEGANEFVNDALRRVPENEAESRAILITESARLVLISGDSKRASALLDTAQQLFRGYDQIWKVLAMIDKEHGRFGQAAELLGRRYEQTKSTEALYDYAEMLDLAGRKAQAAAAFRDFENKALSESAQPNNANRQLVLYYADHSANTSKALRLARAERSIRHDIPTLDALAWALFRNGKIEEARTEMRHALETGTRDPDVLYHAKRLGVKR